MNLTTKNKFDYSETSFMHQDKAELYVRIVPFTNADHKRISRNKNNPLQRIKVSNNTTLNTISSYIHGQANSTDQSQYSVSLHVPFSNKCVQLPLSMSVADFLLITNQINQGELRYRFDKNDEQKQNQPPQPPPPPNPTMPIIQPPILQNKNANLLNLQKSNNFQLNQMPPFPFDINNKIGYNVNSRGVGNNNNMDSPPNYPLSDFQPPPLGTDSNNSIFHSGFHMFSNSFNSFPSLLDSLSYSQMSYESNQNAPSKESISLKNDLEQILRK